MIFVNNLYKEVLESELKTYDHIRIISGYASGTFLKKIVSDFPKINIELYIGMAKEGIRKKDHEIFKQICTSNKNIRIFYKYIGRKNHMKIINFFSSDVGVTYVGSSNFSENGFFGNEELLIIDTQDYTRIFRDIHDSSIPCDSKDVENIINIFSDEELPLLNEAENRGNIEVDDSKVSSIDENYMKYSTIEIKKISKFDVEKYLEFDIIPENDLLWEEHGINAWVEEKKNCLLQTSSVNFSRFFPIEKEFEVLIDNKVVNCELSGNFNRMIIFKNMDIYEFFKRKLGIKQNRAISRLDFEKIKKTSVRFFKIQEIRFVMKF